MQHVFPRGSRLFRNEVPKTIVDMVFEHEIRNNKVSGPSGYHQPHYSSSQRAHWEETLMRRKAYTLRVEGPNFKVSTTKRYPKARM